MKLNYLMLPENFQSRPRPGHRVKKVSQAFSPVSIAGRRVQGEAKKTATVAGNAKKNEEVRAEEFTKFVKTLNKVAAQRRAPPPAVGVVEADTAPRPMRTSDRRAAWLARSADAASSGSRLSRKREAAKSATESISRRAVRRVNAEAMSSSAKPEDIPQPHNPVNQIQVVANVIDVNHTNQHQAFVGPTDTRLDNGGILYHQLPGADTIHNQPFDQHPVHGVIPPAFSHNVMAHQDVLFPGPGIHNHDCLELERTAIACAYMGMDEPMDTSPDFLSREANDGYRDLERTAFACAYAAMDEPMDTTLDDTQGPMAHVVHQNVPPLIGFVGNLQEPQFDHAVTFQQPVYETLRPPDHQHLFDQEYHLWPLGYAHIPNQIVPQPHQELFVNENLPLGHYDYQAGHYPHDEEYLGVLPEFGHNAPIHLVVQQVFYEQDIPGMTPVQQQPEIIHHQPIGHAVHFDPAVQEEHIAQGLLYQHPHELVLEHGLGADWNACRGWQDVGEEGQHDEADFFVDVFGENIREQEEPNRHTGEARIFDLFEELFGDNDDDDDDNEENELQIIL